MARVSFNQGSLGWKLAQVPDARRQQGKRHPHEAVLRIVAAAVASNMRSYSGFAQWAASLSQSALRRFGCRRDLKTKRYVAPSLATIRRVLLPVDPILLADLLGENLVEPGVAVLAVDGKTLRGTRSSYGPAEHVLSAYDVNTGVVLASRSVGAKTNEITEFQPLLSGLDLTGTVVTADAMHTQREHARFLVEEKGADFLFMAKENQLGLQQDLQAIREEHWSAPVVVTEKAHGRLETRTTQTCEMLNSYLDFPNVLQVFRITRTATNQVTGVTRSETCYGVTSLSPEQASVARIGELARGHWGIENRLHYVKDVSFGEDASKIRTGNAASALACLRNAVLTCLRRQGHLNIAAALRENAWDWRGSLALLSS